MIESQKVTRTTDILKTVSFLKKATFASDNTLRFKSKGFDSYALLGSIKFPGATLTNSKPRVAEHRNSSRHQQNKQIE
ncbi:hypothetical protein T03_1944 [Trichinella britovi]|uniref:Uncharacterized protein n=1 Tax=Trichinella britovi TaxID=45882 RepID=A0A0V1C664_TRIBR|nr:hypothetical protein T03_1944 [Trichinella britovi]